ncbi:unnamed protein product [Adineta ricciae]|uniref:Uncharacterized protein n=1 Tax=Adineta ricciae TaxID=249248 RepID=A0A814KZE5_ADIRI|nr:unnamed protein product [Adineta ricciae]CAF1058903.1 unnamed protein product [Adineta ricciae]
MQERRQQLKIPPAWQPDEWICNHSGSRQSTRMDNYFVYQQSKNRSATSYRSLERSPTPKRISTAKLRRQIENLSLKSAEYRQSARQSKVKRLRDTISPVSYKSFYSYALHRHLPTPPIHIPKMSKQSLKRWLDARDAYLGHNYPYIQDGLRRHQRLRRRKARKETNTMIDYDETVTILSMESDRFTLPELTYTNSQRRLSRKESFTRRLSRSETNLRRPGSLLQRIKSFVRSPVASLNRLPCRKRARKKTVIIWDNFDDKCIGTETSESTTSRTNIKRSDQGVQANLPRPRIELHHEIDTSMVVGEKRQRTRPVRKDVEYHDKAIETDFIENFVTVQREKKEKEVNAHKNDKTTRSDAEKENINPSTSEQYNVEQYQASDNDDDKHHLPSMSTSDRQRNKKTNEAIKASRFTNAGNRIAPLTDLFHSSTINENDKQNESRSAIVTPTESNTSVHEQLYK